MTNPCPSIKRPVLRLYSSIRHFSQLMTAEISVCRSLMMLEIWVLFESSCLIYCSSFKSKSFSSYWICSSGLSFSSCSIFKHSYAVPALRKFSIFVSRQSCCNVFNPLFKVVADYPKSSSKLFPVYSLIDPSMLPYFMLLLSLRLTRSNRSTLPRWDPSFRSPMDCAELAPFEIPMLGYLAPAFGVVNVNFLLRL